MTGEGQFLAQSFYNVKNGSQLLCQKVCQRISVTKTNTGVFVVFKTKCELKCQFFDELSDVIIEDPFLTL